MIKALRFSEAPARSATAEDISRFEAKFNVELPTALRDFCSRYNGGYPSSDNECYLVPARFKLFHAEYPTGDGGIVADGLFGLSTEIPGVNLWEEILDLPRVSEQLLLPISFDLSGNFAVMFGRRVNEVVYWWDHELWEGPSKPLLLPIADSLEMFYNGLTKDPST